MAKDVQPLYTYIDHTRQPVTFVFFFLSCCCCCCCYVRESGAWQSSFICVTVVNGCLICVQQTRVPTVYIAILKIPRSEVMCWTRQNGIVYVTWNFIFCCYIIIIKTSNIIIPLYILIKHFNTFIVLYALYYNWTTATTTNGDYKSSHCDWKRTHCDMFQRRKIGRQAVDLFSFTFQMNFTPTLF